MSKVLLDTDILSEILKGKNSTVMKRAAEYLAVEGRYTTTVLSVMEVVRGFYRIGAVDRADQFVSFLSGANSSNRFCSTLRLRNHAWGTLGHVLIFRPATRLWVECHCYGG